MGAAWRGMWAIVRKDLAVWVRSPVVLAVTVLPTLVMVLVLGLQAVAVGSMPVAVVNRDGGGAAASPRAALKRDRTGAGVRRPPAGVLCRS